MMPKLRQLYTCVMIRTTATYVYRGPFDHRLADHHHHNVPVCQENTQSYQLPSFHVYRSQAGRNTISSMLCSVYRDGALIHVQVKANDVIAETSTNLTVKASSQNVQRDCWLVTEKINKEVLDSISKGSIFVVATARHQGWVSYSGQESHSWFELAVVNKEVRFNFLKTLLLGKRLTRG